MPSKNSYTYYDRFLSCVEKRFGKEKKALRQVGLCSSVDQRSIQGRYNVRIENLDDLTSDDAKAEGIMRKYVGCEAARKGLPGPYIENCPKGCSCLNVRELFFQLWDHLNAKRGYGWRKNPYLSVYEFMRLDMEKVKEAAI